MQVSNSHGFTMGILPANCPSRTVLDHVTSKWGVLVIIALSEQSLRWGELRRVVEGVSEKMLAQTLQALERDGFVHREAQPTIPPKVEYSLTPSGEKAAELLLGLIDFIEGQMPEVTAANARYDEAKAR